MKEAKPHQLFTLRFQLHPAGLDGGHQVVELLDSVDFGFIDQQGLSRPLFPA
jgi:hypothetical protein